MAPDEQPTRSLSFGAIAEDYDRFRPGPPLSALPWLLPPTDAGAVTAVDVGAGTGALTRLLVAHVDGVIAVEPDIRMAAVLARRVPDAAIVAGRAEELPLRPASVDAVMGSSMWHWVDEERAVSEAARVLRPGGALGVLWSGPDRTQPWLAELLATVRPIVAAGATAPRRHRRALHLPEDAPFTPPQTRTVQWSLAVSTEDFVELACTYSGFIVLPDDEKARRRQALVDAVAHHRALTGTGPIAMPMRCICWRAVRTGAGAPPVEP